MRALIAVTFLALAAAQLFHWPFSGGRESDRHAGFTFEYHSRHHLLVVRDRHNCYLIDAHQDVISAFRSKDQQDTLEDDIIGHIKSHDISHKESHLSALRQFHDILEAGECARKRLFVLDYVLKSSLAMTTMMPPTMA